FRIEVIKVPLAHPDQAAIVSSPRIFNDLVAPPRHGETPEDSAAAAKEAAAARAAGKFTAMIHGQEMILPAFFTGPLLDSVTKTRHPDGPPTAADSAALRDAMPSIIAAMMAAQPGGGPGPHPGPTQCHDITV